MSWIRKTCWAALLASAACSGRDETRLSGWKVVAEAQSSALMSVNGTAPDDVWLASADDGEGPLVLHWNGSEWQRHATGVSGDLWWVHALPSGVVHFGGSDATVLAYQSGVFERMATPGLGKPIVFEGRRVGARVGALAVQRAQTYFVGSR